MDASTTVRNGMRVLPGKMLWQAYAADNSKVAKRSASQSGATTSEGSGSSMEREDEAGDADRVDKVGANLVVLDTAEGPADLDAVVLDGRAGGCMLATLGPADGAGLLDGTDLDVFAADWAFFDAGA
jgi:hypothetical protein